MIPARDPKQKVFLILTGDNQQDLIEFHKITSFGCPWNVLGGPWEVLGGALGRLWGVAGGSLEVLESHEANVFTSSVQRTLRYTSCCKISRQG